MVLKEFTLDIPGKGRVDVSFYLRFDTRPVSVSEIKIHPDFDSTLPHRAYLKEDENGVWKLFDEHPAMINNEVVVQPEFLNDDVSNAIAQRILAIREAEM